MRPDFFVVGAPKCGTTALCEYLRAHPRIGFSIPKEPHYFATDRPALRQLVTEAEYLQRGFSHCPTQALAVGEGSTHYLLSETAVPAILDFEPRARFVAMVRSPIDMVRALHHDNVFNLVEDEPDFARAWARQAERRRGRHLPARCRTPQLLDYATAGLLGRHLTRLRDTVPPSRLHVIVFDDLVRDPGAVYRGVLAFLGVPDDGRRDFPVHNERRIQSDWYRSAAARIPPGFGAGVTRIRRALGLAPFGLRRRIGEATARPVSPAPLPPSLHAELVACFRDDVAVLADLLGRDLHAWLEPTEPLREERAS